MLQFLVNEKRMKNKGNKINKQRFVLPPHLRLEILESLAEKANITLSAVANSKGSGLLKFFSE